MKAILVAVNAKYPHVNPAVRSIVLFARQNGIQDIGFIEFSVNQRADFILSKLYETNSDIVLFSCYIWNIELIRTVARELRKLHPAVRLWAGGPEVSWCAAEFLQENPAFDLIVRGEGEEVVTALLEDLNQGADYTGRPGITWRKPDGRSAQNPAVAPPHPDLLPFPYHNLPALSGRVLYLESMRGCPFRCSYCISSIENGVRMRSLDLVKADLLRLLEAGARRVKFVDRTFNCDPQRAREVWQFLMERDNGVTNFHFELAGELLDEESLKLLEAARPGLFQFEIGVQSTNLETLREIGRSADTGKLFYAVDRLQQRGNIHLHLDLIAGLPYESFSRFAQSFDDVYAHAPHQLQLGFLKVLKGCVMEQNADEYGLLYRDQAPYEVLCSSWISYPELERLKGAAEMVELYYNSGRFEAIITELCKEFSSPFVLYDALALYWKQSGCLEAPPDKIGCYELLGRFIEQQIQVPNTARLQWLCRFDLLRHERLKRVPDWVKEEPDQDDKRLSSDFLRSDLLEGYLPHLAAVQSRQRVGVTALERFPFDPQMEETRPVWLLFDYTSRDVLGHACVLRVADADIDHLQNGGAM